MRAALGIALVCLAASAVGCNDNTVSTVSAPPASTTTSRLTRGTVTWPDAAKIDERALAALGKSAREGKDALTSGELSALIARSPVPVLAPSRLVLTSPTLVVEGEYFALSGRLDGATIALQGTRAAHRYEGLEPVAGDRDLRATKGFVSVNEGIRTASWMENGAAYSVDVECADVVNDARCASDDFLLSVVAQLAYVGGSGR
jgi:hypothetical protein